MIFANRGQAKEAGSQHVRDLEAQIAAMDSAQGVLELQMDGTVIRANANFLAAMGYAAAEVEGRNHSLFLPASAAGSEADLWKTLREGQVVRGKVPRAGKGGREVWFRAAYAPVFDKAGRPTKVICFTTDVSDAEIERARIEAERASAAKEQSEVIGALATNLRRLSDGDLAANIDRPFQGAYAQIREDFNQTAAALREAIGAISAATSGLRGGSEEIASASDNLSRRTEQQAASLEETAAALDEVTATIKRSAEGARQASAAASSAKDEAERSGSVVREAVAAMGEIEESSGKISQIIGVIDEIAFQTNLLALNAGVEAARAGEAGRGFAVVAQEVRALAQRSADAAKEIKALISSSTAHVDRGVRLVGDTGQALEGIVGKVAEIDGLISEIALSSQEQATGLNQVNSAVNQMDQVTQQNAAMVEEVTAAATSLKVEAAELARLVSRFRTGDTVAASHAPASGRASRQAA
jgi:methyl-accepting chemotaxis protein